MSSRLILLALAWMMAATVHAQTGKKTKLPKAAKGIAKKRAVTEAEAKRLHEAQMAQSGKTGVRKAYKRSQFEQPAVGENLAVETAPVLPKPNTTVNAPQSPVPKEQAAPKPLKFIESIVLTRHEG